MAKRRVSKRRHRWSGAGYVCADCGAIKDTNMETKDCPGDVKKALKWKRVAHGHQKLVDKNGLEMASVMKIENCGYWYVYLLGCDEPDGERFSTMWEAKQYSEEEVAIPQPRRDGS